MIEREEERDSTGLVVWLWVIWMVGEWERVGEGERGKRKERERARESS